MIEFSSVIGDIYDAAIEPALWKQTLGNICSYVGGYSATLFWHDAATQNAQALYLFNDDPEYTQLYFKKYVSMDPFFPASSFMEVGEVHGANDIIPQAELAETRFYKEWIEPQGIGDAIAVNLEKGLTRSSFIVIRTDAATGAADESMYGRLAALVPHLQRAVAIGRLLDQSKVAEQRLTETLNRVEAAVFLIGRNGAITFTNDPARALINEGLLLRQQDGALHAIDANADRILGEMILSAEKGDASIGVRGVAVPLMNSAQERWFAHVLPLTSGRRRKDGNAHAAVAALFIRNTPPNAPLPLESLAKRYKLTASEVRVLDAVLKISGVKAIADMLGLSQATVKTHLHNLFRKTGASRQSDLVKLIAGI